jgi:hypothetical protein
MPYIDRFTLSAIIAIALSNASAAAEVAPTNGLPNPYQTVAPWEKLPDERRGARSTPSQSTTMASGVTAV